MKHFLLKYILTRHQMEMIKLPRCSFLLSVQHLAASFIFHFLPLSPHLHQFSFETFPVTLKRVSCLLPKGKTTLRATVVEIHVSLVSPRHKVCTHTQQYIPEVLYQSELFLIKAWFLLNYSEWTRPSTATSFFSSLSPR